MFYRRKVILALLEALGDPPPTMTDFQKHLFLFTQKQSDPSYEFVPHTYGCYSFSAQADHAPMVRKGLLTDEDNWTKATSRKFAKELKDEDLTALIDHREAYGSLRGRELIELVYTEYPYYTIHSEIAEEVLGRNRMERVNAEYRREEGPGLFTIGYEGRSLENYLNALITRQIDLVVDVRMNPVSRKFGFSKSTLASTLRRCNIKYNHVPTLGIRSSKRSGLKSDNEFRELFEEYRREVLPERQQELDRISSWVDHDGLRVALTCFERDHVSCHRDSVSQAVCSTTSWSHPVQHL